MGRKGDGRLFEFVDHTTSVGVRSLTTRLGVDEDTARDVMREIIYDVCSAWGRTQMYVPAVLELGRTDRDERIWKAYSDPAPKDAAWRDTRPFSHERLVAIAETEQLSPRHVYSIVGLVRRRIDEERYRDVLKRQGTLPGLEPDDQA